MTEPLQFDDIFGRVVKILANELRVAPGAIEKETLIFEQLGADSLDAVSIALRLEQEFKIHIPDDQIRNFRTPGSIVQGIQAYFSQ
ncbi:MAG: acyl carrier protein [Acidobacteria bacterium]|nr:acyl carrier protein [Acidobacteriota bacterium]